jgi:hypothetical protein
VSRGIVGRCSWSRVRDRLVQRRRKGRAIGVSRWLWWCWWVLVGSYLRLVNSLVWLTSRKNVTQSPPTEVKAYLKGRFLTPAQSFAPWGDYTLAIIHREHENEIHN